VRIQPSVEIGDSGLMVVTLLPVGRTLALEMLLNSGRYAVRRWPPTLYAGNNRVASAANGE
jgi:hypothetical protein